MRLSDLTGGNGGASRVEISGISADSRDIKPGYLFAALAGTQAKGTDFIDDAISHGAVAILAQPDVAVDPTGAYLVEDQNPRRRLALMAARFYELQPEHIVAVTGTNGKSSVVDFVRQIWEQLGHKSASLGTLGVQADGIQSGPTLTTPDPVAIHASMRDLKLQDVDHLALEASSHGLEQFRLDGVRLSAAAFTNLSRDHLDYHGDLETYFLAKLRLFGEVLPPASTAVINHQDEFYDRLVDVCWARGLNILSIGTGDQIGADLYWTMTDRSATGQTINVRYQGREWSIDLPLIGAFQASNALVAAALVVASGAEMDHVLPTLGKLTSVHGRMQLVGSHPSGAPVYIDYAHTPDALQTVLSALRPHTSGKLSVVFGCGGDRDQGKRPMMGAIAAELADRVYVTDDNPRHEDADAIRQAVMEGCPSATEIAGRSEAIHAAVQGLQAGDVLVIAGKGHETGQIIGDDVLPFDDATEAMAALEAANG